MPPQALLLTRCPLASPSRPLQLTDPNANWVPLGQMPQSRVMGDSLYMCNGDILFLNGGHQGVAVSYLF